MEFIYYIFAFAFGAAIGSFLNVIIYRLPREESIAFPPSHCPTCDEPIKWYDNIPILSYLLLNGRCRKCNSSISIQYPIVEFLTAILFVLLLHKFGLAPTLFTYIIFSCLLLAGSIIDLTTFLNPPEVKMPVKLKLPAMVVVSDDIEKTESMEVEGILEDDVYQFDEKREDVEISLDQNVRREKLPSISVIPVVIEKGIIPDEISYSGIFLGLFFALISDISAKQFMIWEHNPLRNAVGGLVLALGVLFLVGFFFKIFMKKEGLGLGDVKLFGFIGVVLGIKLGLLTVFISSLLGLIVMLSCRFGRSKPFPFGPFLGLGAFIALFLGDKILSLAKIF